MLRSIIFLRQSQISDYARVRLAVLTIYVIPVRVFPEPMSGFSASTFRETPNSRPGGHSVILKARRVVRLCCFASRHAPTKAKAVDQLCEVGKNVDESHQGRAHQDHRARREPASAGAQAQVRHQTCGEAAPLHIRAVTPRTRTGVAVPCIQGRRNGRLLELCLPRFSASLEKTQMATAGHDAEFAGVIAPADPGLSAQLCPPSVRLASILRVFPAEFQGFP